MPNLALELAKQWMEKAEHDLVTARAVLALPDGPTDTPCFHAQQAIEKVLKALLTARGMRFEKVHDLMAHCDAAIPHAPELKAHRERIAALADYAVQVRYPGDWEEPKRADALAAVDEAEQVVGLVAKAISIGKKPRNGGNR
jgi:HEPN domain-containing protein